jgi:hypothetical protein
VNCQPNTAHQGRIPFRLRIGVTGHRRLPDEEALAEQVKRALQRIRQLVPSSPHTPVLFTVISPLAEGADRLVAREVLKDEGADLEVPLPLPRAEYLRDFQSDESKREFEGLLSQAREVTELGPSESREAAYESVGRYVVDRCDVLIALWDGEGSRGQGGTAEIVEYARGSEEQRQPESNPGRGPSKLVQNATRFMRRHGIFARKPSSSGRQRCRVPLFWIPTKGGHELLEELGDGINSMSLRQLDEYNRAKITQERFDPQVSQHQSQLLVAGQRSDTGALPLQVISEWVSPFYVRADLLAMRCQNWYYILSNALFLLAAAAVAAIASQVVLAPERLELVWIEVALMLGVLLIVLIDRRWHFHGRWISYRFLAERFRSAFFLALAGVPGFREASLDRVYLGHASEEWLRRAFGEVWSRRPQAELAESSVEDLRQLLTKAWIEDQRNFHRSAHHKYRFRHLRLSRATEFLFGATVLAALLHATGVVEEGSAGPLSWSDLLILLAISLPALGAALGAIRAEREYMQNSDRYDEMVCHLGIIERRMQAAVDLEAVRRVATDAENLMLQENRNWYVLMRPRRPEPV